MCATTTVVEPSRPQGLGETGIGFVKDKACRPVIEARARLSQIRMVRAALDWGARKSLLKTLCPRIRSVGLRMVLELSWSETST